MYDVEEDLCRAEIFLYGITVDRQQVLLSVISGG